MNMRGQVVVKHYTGGTWVDSTDGILDINIVRGIPDYVGCWSQVQPGQLQLRSRDLSLSNIALKTRIRIEVDGSPIFTGKVYDINTEYIPKEDSIVTITSFDELAELALKKFGHQTVIGGDYKGRTLASFLTFPNMLTQFQMITSSNGGVDGPYGILAADGTDYEGNALGYSMANTNYGGSFNPPLPAPGDSSDSTWGTYLNSPSWDVDGLIIPNPTTVDGTEGGWGIPCTNTYATDYANRTTSVTGNGYDGFKYNLVTPYSSKSSVNDSGHPLNGDTGFYKKFYRTPSLATGYGNWANLMTTNDTDALTLFLKAEQSEAGFAFVDTRNRFRLYSRAVVDNDTHLSKATFASDGSGISYNNIKVTNGWESVVNGVTVSNTWSNDWIDFFDLAPWPDNDNDGNITNFYTNSGSVNRDGTTTNRTLNFATAPTANKPKDYEWLNYNIIESKGTKLKYCKVFGTSTYPLFQYDTRDYSLDKLTTLSYFQGQTGLGTKQLQLNTTYAFASNTGPGYLLRRNGVQESSRATALNNGRDYNVDERSAELADYILTNYSTATKDIRSISFSVHQSDIDTIKNIDIYDRITIDHNDSGFVVDKQYCIMGINHYITPNNWEISYQLWNQQGRP